MSEARDPRPNMVAPNPYGGPTLPLINAEDWRPDGTEGEVMVQVTKECRITESFRQHGYEVVVFPVGTYLVPTRIRVKRRVPVGDGITEEREVWVNIGGVDEDSMRPYLKEYGVKHASIQPTFSMKPTVPPVFQDGWIERFCSYCGRERSGPHKRGCPSYVPPARANEGKRSQSRGPAARVSAQRR